MELPVISAAALRRSHLIIHKLFPNLCLRRDLLPAFAARNATSDRLNFF
jgi:hypothetical protein